LRVARGRLIVALRSKHQYFKPFVFDVNQPRPAKQLSPYHNLAALVNTLDLSYNFSDSVKRKLYLLSALQIGMAMPLSDFKRPMIN
jgi:hypothetical protein